jgi:hypothetical protein
VGNYELPFALRSPRWPLILAALAAMVLVLGIRQVVRQAVREGELRRQAVAAHAQALWRCNVQRGKDKREACKLQVPPRDEAKPQDESPLALAHISR